MASNNARFYVMKKFVTIYKVLIALFLVIIISTCLSYRIGISPVSKNSEQVTIEIKENSTYISIAPLLKENDLIKSELFYKVYIKIFKPNNLQKGTYVLNKNMGVKGIIDKLESNEAVLDTISFVIPEGNHITDVAKTLSSITNYTEQQWLEYWNSEDLINKLISKYWFITEEIKNKDLRYNLEGYFFPATYEIFKSATMEDVTYKMLDKMDDILSKYKNNIDNSDYTVHEILSLASIVEYEAILDEDRPIIARVFLNRLNKGMMLQSCATVGYAIKEWKLTYTYADLQTDSPYNTYKYYGLPVGPGGLAGEASIKAVLYPDDNDYLYFLANVYSNTDNKTYYSKTYSEHQQKCLQYLGKSC